MDINALLMALIYIAILAVIGWVIVAIIGGKVPPVVITIVWAVIAILCLLVLAGAITGNSLVVFR